MRYFCSLYRMVYGAVGNYNHYNIGWPDFSKAFDKVPHVTPFKMIRAHRIDGKVVSKTGSRLSDGQQRVTIND